MITPTGDLNFKPTEYETIDLITPDPLEPTEGIGSKMLDEKCWPGYKKKGMKTMFGKRYPNCVKANEETECSHTKKGKDCPVHGVDACPDDMEEAVQIPRKTGNIVEVFLTWRGKMLMIKMFFPSVKKPSRSEVQDQLDKVYPGSKVSSYRVSDIKPGEQFLQTEGTENPPIPPAPPAPPSRLEEGTPAWQRKEGKSESGGLNAKGSCIL